MEYNAINNRFTLERYRSGGANRFTCPNCGKAKCFARYIDTVTGEYLADDCGKCNHESSCGYHYPPREYFRYHQEIQISNENHGNYVNVAPVVTEQSEFFDLDWAKAAVGRSSTFRSWFEILPYDEDCIKKVLDEYLVGGTAKDIVVGGVNHGPAVVFWMIDEQQRVHDAKLIAYKTDGHRVADRANSMRSICKKKGIGPQLEWTVKVLFGLHLLPRYPDKAVCIVESEKTALICACRYPKFLWLATGGCSNLQAEKLKPLMNRRVIIYPDSGEYDKWKEKMEASGHKDYIVIDFAEKFESNTDIADILLGEAKRKS